MKKEWFVLHTLTGQEMKVCKSINIRRGVEAVEDYVGDCIMPSEKVVEKKNGKSRTISKKFFPGYVLCELALYDESRGIDPNTGKRAIYERTWQFLRDTNGVIGFIGGNKENPIPLSAAEMEAILSTGKGGKSEPPARPKVTFAIGEVVKINEGPFQGQVGQVSVVDPNRGKLTVEVEIFSRKSPVDVEYWQVEKVKDEDLHSVNG